MSKTHTGLLLIVAALVLYVGSFMLMIRSNLGDSHIHQLRYHDFTYSWQEHFYRPLVWVDKKLYGEEYFVDVISMKDFIITEARIEPIKKEEIVPFDEHGSVIRNMDNVIITESNIEGLVKKEKVNY